MVKVEVLHEIKAGDPFPFHKMLAARTDIAEQKRFITANRATRAGKGKLQMACRFQSMY